MPDSVHVIINQLAYELAAGATLLDAVSVSKAQPPFAAAVNLQFVPNSQYLQTLLHNGDRIDIIAPVIGG